jgi:hypothetical protein
MIKRFALAVPVLVGLIGCSNNYVRDPIQPRQDVYHSTDRVQIFFDSTDLRNDTAADTPSVIRDQNGLLHVTVPIRSVINKQLYVEYRVIFFDRDHQEIDRSPWRDKTLPANLPESVIVNSTTPRAESFQVHFRYPTGSEM